jgi:hypothetical protein
MIRKVNSSISYNKVDSVKELAAEGDQWKMIIEVGVEEKIKRIAVGDR